MFTKRIYLYDDDSEVYLDVYVAEPTRNFTRKAMLVIPGGGYNGLSSEREGEPIAMAFIAQGYNAFVLRYTVGRKRVFPAQLIEASMAMKHIKDHAEEYNINPDKVFTVGFSAGGHLAGCLGLMWNKKEIYEAVDMPYGYNKPAGMMLIYPAVTGVAEYGHLPSFCNLLGTDTPDKEQLMACSLEQNVTKEAAPLFLMHTSNDKLADVRNSLCLAEKYRENDLTFEMHIYPDGPHGIALGNEITSFGMERWINPNIAKWVNAAITWADGIQ